ncbi:hypothetical protein BDM02DRAFT_3221793 [Thelephora ganbajun]|uniref:Uncharacterized protein n=1 Tax=Thelephora ganbajun TaxID=370292 RepID=A0ACB6Z1W8_THEGA|nr:hypothetical protein BDM02DRAFT_3221793 [Thelephora ganbajun]
MRFVASIIVLAAPLFVAAAPWKRQDSATNLLVLKFADVLEQLESKFYAEALAKFNKSDFTTAGFTNAQLAIEQFLSIQGDEATHSVALREGIKSLGSTPVDTCTFDFSKVLTDVTTMANVARLVENVGVTAYLGAAHLLSDPVLLTAAGSILTVEARHQTILNVLNAGTAIPQAFDFAFTPNEVLALAGPFISGCDLGIRANPSLAITNTGTVGVGTLLTFSSPAINGSTDGLFCQMLVGGLPFTISLPLAQCIVPDGINGPVALWVTSDSQPLINNPRDRAIDKLVAGPTIAFLDTKPQILGQLARTLGGTPPTVTNTVTPDQASSIISYASPLPTP